MLDGDLTLFESHSILRYICETRNLDDHWYPKDQRKRAKVDEYLDWHHNAIRLGASGYFFRRYISRLIGKPASEGQVNESWELLTRSLKKIENYWFKDKN